MLKSVLRAQHNPNEVCLENTRTMLLTKVDGWVRGSSDEKTMWIYGRAGSGKSALFNSIAEILKNEGIPFTCFPCRRDDPELSNIHRVLPTIAYSFTEHYGDYRSAISDVLNKSAGDPLGTSDVKRQSELLFGKTYDLIHPNGASRSPVHVVLVDAPDECRNHRDGNNTSHERRALLVALRELAGEVPWIRILITSRPEPDIDGVFKDTSGTVCHLDIDDDEWRTPAAIRLFILDASEELGLTLSHDQIERLRERSSGLFIWCTTAFLYIKERMEDSKHAIEAVLKDQPLDPGDNPYSLLFLLYQHVMDTAAPETYERQVMESILALVFVTPLSITGIIDIIYPNEEDERLKERREKIENIIRSLSAILYVEEGSNIVHTRHITVLDFLERELMGKVPTRVFVGCLEVMNRDLRFNICDLEDSHRLNKDVNDLPVRIARNISEALRYAALFWFYHLKQLGLGDYEEKACTFLNSPKALYWVELLSLLGAVEQGILILQDCSRLLTVRPSSINVVQ